MWGSATWVSLGRGKRQNEARGFQTVVQALSGPVFLATVELQDLGFWEIGCHTPALACALEVRYPPIEDGYLSDTSAIPHDNAEE